MSLAYLFDVGNVIIAFDFNKAASKLAPLCDAPATRILELVCDLTQALELGNLNADQFIAEASQRIGYQGTPEFFRASFEDIFTLNHKMVEFIEAQKALGIPMHLLSNTNDIHVPFFEKTYPVFNLFEGKIYSYEVGAMKPDPKIYLEALSRLELDPQNTIYIDDLPANCAAGEKAGFVTIPYDISRHDQFLECLSNTSI